MLPRRCRLSPGLHLVIAGNIRGSARASPGYSLNRSWSGVDRDSAGLLIGLDRNGTGKSVTT
ncbi:hypothetical protein DPMN_130400 [Dreissena polymorpha]|uniref:Uncharacterized protein n=1 Tax=Dreissena polymorpha TaxID=45954 RepID=A0A9D4K1S1_DREPO|nr:hypothetical protein DPMN_130400 [Dreissena polymorpha]